MTQCMTWDTGCHSAQQYHAAFETKQSLGGFLFILSLSIYTFELLQRLVSISLASLWVILRSSSANIIYPFDKVRMEKSSYWFSSDLWCLEMLKSCNMLFQLAEFHLNFFVVKLFNWIIATIPLLGQLFYNSAYIMSLFCGHNVSCSVWSLPTMSVFNGSIFTLSFFIIRLLARLTRSLKQSLQRWTSVMVQICT